MWWRASERTRVTLEGPSFHEETTDNFSRCIDYHGHLYILRGLRHFPDSSRHELFTIWHRRCAPVLRDQRKKSADGVRLWIDSRSALRGIALWPWRVAAMLVCAPIS